MWVRPGTLLRMIVTFSLICVTWIFFRAATLQDAWVILVKIVQDVWFLESYQALGTAVLHESATITTLCLVVLFTAWEWINRREEHVLKLKRVPWPGRWAIYTVLLFAILWWGTQSTVNFIYFQF